MSGHPPPTQQPAKPPPSRETEEEVYADDTMVARAFRWSFLLMAVLAVGGVGLWLALRPRPAPAVTQVTPLSAPVLPTRPAAEIPAARFTDVTAAAGIRFVHCSGAAGEKLLPETMGGGVAFFDCDGDGDQDLLFINSTWWPWDTRNLSKPGPTPVLYRNDGHGRFADVTAGSGLEASFYGMGVAIGDYDGDGHPDVFITAVGQNRLFRNLGNARFAEVTRDCGLAGSPGQWSTCAAWIDYDNDGNLDLFVGNYVGWSREIDFEVGYKLVGIGRAYGQPMNFEGTFPCLHRNDGGGRFTDVSAAAGVQVANPATGRPMAKTLGVAPVDLDGDGWIDLVVANDTVQNFLFHNQGNGTFKEIGALSGVAFDSNGLTRGAMGIDAARYRNDATLGIAIGNFANEMTALYASQGRPLLFVDEAIAEGVGPASRLLLKFGIFFFDYDLDGRLDLLTANGHLEEDIGKIQASQSYAQPAQLFWNCGFEERGCYTVVGADRCGEDLFQPMVGRGSAFADIDGDGDLDVVLTQVNGPPKLLRNDQQTGHHWLRLRLVGARGNRDALGAWVNLRLGDQVLSRQVMPTRSYLSQSELPVTFGLGNADRFDELEVIWPGGERQRITHAPIDTTTVIQQPAAAARRTDAGGYKVATKANNSGQ